MHYYVGVDPPGSPTIPLVPTAGKGVWPQAELTDDQDDRDAASANLGAEAAHDKANFLGWRMINIIEGGTYTYTSSITIRNSWTFTGPNFVWGASASWAFWAPAVVALNATLYIGDPSGFAGNGHVVVKNGSDITVDGASASIHLQNGADLFADGAGSNIVLENTAHFSLGVDCTATLAGTTTQTGPYLQSGSDGWQKKRHHYAANNDVIPDGRAHDIIQCTDIGLSVSGGGGIGFVLKINAPPDDAEEGITLRVYAPKGMATGGTSDNLAFIAVESPAGTPIGTGFAAIDGSGNTDAPCFIDLEIVQSGGGAHRKWQATGRSAPWPVPGTTSWPYI